MAHYISYAQFREDILLLRAVQHVHHDQGFYIDVGANDPVRESVTKVFYDHGWRGINIDASEKWVERLKQARARDINIHAAISDKAGEVTFYDQPEGGLGTTVESIAAMHHSGPKGLKLAATTVPAQTLTEICEKYAPSEIHFLKIDVEGGEGSVLRGMDFSRFRPWVMCIECHLPDHPEVQVYDEWEPYVFESGYRFVYTDTFNRYYVSHDHPELFEKFVVPADDYSIFANVREIQELKDERDALKQDVARLHEDLTKKIDELHSAKLALEQSRLDKEAGIFRKLVRQLRLR